MRREGDQSMPGPMGQKPGDEQASQDYSRQLQKERQSRVIKVLVALVLAVILIIFIVSNSQHVAVDYVFFTRHPRLIWVMFACAVAGGIVGYLIGRPGKQVRFRRKKDEESK